MPRPGPENPRVNVGVLGVGNVGSEVIRQLQSPRLQGENIHVTRVAVAHPTAERRERFPGLTGDAMEVVRDPNVHIIVEAMGGLYPAGSLIDNALREGKSVVSANKAVVAEKLPELSKAAAAARADLSFEAAIAGGAPVVRPLLGALRHGEDIIRIGGVLNGTTQFVLTKMAEGRSYEEALQIAQDEGFAEADPKLDVNGSDTRSKLGILASLAFGIHVVPAQIPFEGIESIIPDDHEAAEKFGRGYRVKLLGIAEKDEDTDTVRLGVRPALVSADHPLSLLRNEESGVFWNGNLVEQTYIQAEGAGARPTASAVVEDIIYAADNIRSGTYGRLPSLDGDIAVGPYERVEELNGRPFIVFDGK